MQPAGHPPPLRRESEQVTPQRTPWQQHLPQTVSSVVVPKFLQGENKICKRVAADVGTASYFRLFLTATWLI